MPLERERLLALIEFAQQSVLLRIKPAASIAAHGSMPGAFALYEHQLRGLPGINLGVADADEDDEIWLAVKRLHEIPPPSITNALLKPWVAVARGPGDEPQLLRSTPGSALIAAGTHCSDATPPPTELPAIDPSADVALAEFDLAPQVSAHFTTYVETKWRPWADEEKLRRRTIALYSKLFTLKQQIEGAISEATIELVWGTGVGIWTAEGTSVSYPLIGQLVEIALNPATADIEVRPRNVDPRLELDWYSSVDNAGVAPLTKAAKEFWSHEENAFSSFDRGTYEPLLRTAVTHLDANGIYWPNEVPPDDRGLPPSDDRLKVTDTWVLFARPRTNNLFLQDLVRLKKRVEEADVFPPAVAALVTDPATSTKDVDLPTFRGVSAAYDGERPPSDHKPRDLYFPKPFNDEQVRIIQLLEVSDGVVVQGPPGTGKTHTIANVICHFLAEGKRVLVTSMKDPALAVLHEQLPAAIRPLAISLLSSEQDGMKQFAHAIERIASEVQGLDRAGTAKNIAHLQDFIDGLHGKLATIDHRVGEWAKRNLSKITLESEDLDPESAARAVVDGTGSFEWLADSIGVGQEFAPQFFDADIIQLRDARRILGSDIKYLGASLPQLIDFPDSAALLGLHQDLSQFERLTHAIEAGDVPALADSSQETLASAQALLADIQVLARLHAEVRQSQLAWTEPMRGRLHRGDSQALLRTLEELGAALEEVSLSRKAFLTRPVTTPPGIELEDELTKAVRSAAEGNRPFGLKGLLGKSEQKARLNAIRVLASPPNDPDAWKHVGEYLAMLRQLRELAIRWNAIAPELQVSRTPGELPDDGLWAASSYAVYVKVKSQVAMELRVRAKAAQVLPGWSGSRDLIENPELHVDLESALRHHLTKSRLANVWAVKERCQKVLEGRSGGVLEDIRQFLTDTLGNPTVSDAVMQAAWSGLMGELSRVLALGARLATVRDVCAKIEASGATQYASQLRQPVAGAVDSLLPDDWRNAWRLRRLATHLSSIDPQGDLKRLADDRREAAVDLERAYRDIVVKRTWLKLADNASPSIRAALQAYLNAIKSIGKGTGKRAVRFRADARNAAALANSAVPCWIMAHYRVSESLPPELGCFDLVVVDEASQSDLTALPALLRAKKVLIVGDDKQVSPEGVGLEELQVTNLMKRFLGEQVETYRPQMSPERSIYDLFKVVFATSAVMLREHFRCVGPIIEYSKREFYNHELRPLRMPKSSERLDPPLVDVLIEDGYRSGDLNRPEARFIVDEICAIVADPHMANRSIGVVSLLGDKQALEIWDQLSQALGPELIQRHRIASGDARTFQGKERDIMFLSMVSAPNNLGAPPSRATFAQRYNVAASRARDRMYLVRSVEAEQLSAADRLRRSLIAHFTLPFAQDEVRVADQRTLCESPFEREMYDALTARGYWVTPQVPVGQYRIDMVVEGHNDARLAVECDGDRYHGADKWAADMRRQRDLERAGWTFWRCFASVFLRRQQEVMNDLLSTLAARGIEPIGSEGAPRSVHTERRVVRSDSLGQREVSPIDLLTVDASDPVIANHVAPMPARLPGPPADVERSSAVTLPLKFPPAPPSREVTPPTAGRSLQPPPTSSSRAIPATDYVEYDGAPTEDPRTVAIQTIAEGLVWIVAIEGPVVAKRAFDIYLRGGGVKRMGHDIRETMGRAMAMAVRSGRIAIELEAGPRDPLYCVARIHGSPPIKLRTRGSRVLEEIPPSEIQVAARHLSSRYGFDPGSESHLRAILDFFDLKRLTEQAIEHLNDVLLRDLPYVNDHLG